MSLSNVLPQWCKLCKAIVRPRVEGEAYTRVADTHVVLQTYMTHYYCPRCDSELPFDSLSDDEWLEEYLSKPEWDDEIRK